MTCSGHIRRAKALKRDRKRLCPFLCKWYCGVSWAAKPYPTSSWLWTAWKKMPEAERLPMIFSLSWMICSRSGSVYETGLSVPYDRKEYNKFLNRLHKIRIRYNLSEIDNPSAYTQVSEPMRFLVESALSERTGQSPLLQALRLMECLDGSLGRSVLARTGSHA